MTIDSFATHKFLPRISKDIIPVISGESPCVLPPTACLIDFETLGLDEYSDIILFTIYKHNSFFSYYLTDTSPEGQQNFREFIKYSLHQFDVVYVFHADFESKFFPDIKKFVDIRFKKYQFWASARRLVHLPFHHLEFDPGSGKNIPIWNKLFLLDNNELFMDLILKRTPTNILTKLAIIASNIATIPFYDPIVADIRRVIPPLEFLNELNRQPSLLKKKISFYPSEFYNTYHEQYKEFSEMYVDNLFFIEEKKVD